MSDDQVCRAKPQSKTKLSAAISAGWSRCSLEMGQAGFANAADMDQVTVRRGIAGPSLPSGENIFNSLAADITALNEVMSLYGAVVVRKSSSEVSDMELITGLSGAVAEYLKRIADGRRCHVDEAVLSTLFRPLIAQMQAIVDSADVRQGVVPMGRRQA